MEREPAFRTAVCSEYEALLHKSKAALDDLRRRQERFRQQNESDWEREQAIRRLREYYERLYARLVHHYERCEVCQIAEKARGKAPPRHSRVVPFRKRSA
jgi:hypothetical protein